MARAAPKTLDGDATRFETLYRDCYEDLLRYALRRTELAARLRRELTEAPTPLKS